MCSRRQREEGEGTKGPGLIVGVTFCTSGETSCQIGLRRTNPSGSWMAMRLPGAQLIANPSFKTLLDFDGAYLGGQLNIPFPSSSAPFLASPFILNSMHSPETNLPVGHWPYLIWYFLHSRHQKTEALGLEVEVGKGRCCAVKVEGAGVKSYGLKHSMAGAPRCCNMDTALG